MARLLLLALAPLCALTAAQQQTTATSSAGAGSNFVGWISQSERYVASRTCDFPQTVSTSGAYVQCCSPDKPCAFYTACSSNTLMAASGSPVACDTQPSLTCNTAVVLASNKATATNSYLACWQTSLGAKPFTFVQNIGDATPMPGSSSGSSTGGQVTSTISTTGTGSSSAPMTSSNGNSMGSAPSSTPGSANNAATVLGGGVLGGLALLAVL